MRYALEMLFETSAKSVFSSVVPCQDTRPRSDQIVSVAGSSTVLMKYLSGC